jgi:hypothetical protein
VKWAERDEQVIDIPPLVEPPPPSFSEPTPPPSPFSTPDLGGQTVPPIPSPFSEPKPSTYEPPPAPSFAEREPYREEPSFNPFDQPGTDRAERVGTAAGSGFQLAKSGDRTEYAVSTSAGRTRRCEPDTPIVSLVFGVVSLCCYISPLTGIVALVTGYMGLKNVNNDPQHFGGKGLAIAGMITGGVFLLLGLLYWIYIIFIVGLAAMGSLGNM